MNIEFTAITTSDLLVAINILATSTLSFLIWKATIASNKTTLAIKESGERERRAIENQNRYLASYSIMKMENVLLAHSAEKGFPRNARDDLQESIQQIKNFDLTSFFKPAEIEKIMEFNNYMEKEFMRVFKGMRAYGHDPKENKERYRKYIEREIPIVNEALTKINEIKAYLN